MFVCISGASGSGKSAIIDGVLQKFGDKIALLPSSTTRSIRPGEIPGKIYFYITVDEFKKAIENGEFIEYEQVHSNGNYYGVSRIRYDEYSKHYPILIKDVDVKGTQSIKRAGIDTLTIYIDVKTEELKKRLTVRGDSLNEIELRLARKEFEDSFKNKYDYIIENTNLNDAIEKTAKIIKSEAKKRKILL